MTRWMRWWFIAGMTLTVLVYLPALDAGFVFDDLDNIQRPAGVHWESLSWSSVRGLVDSTLIPRRVVANGTFGLNYLVGGLEPVGYHAVNVVIHLLVGLALVWLVGVYLRGVGWGGGDWSVGLAVVVPVLLYLVHPLNTQAVTYVVQRMASLAALFCLVAFGAYLVGRSRGVWRAAWPWYVVALVAWLVALCNLLWTLPSRAGVNPRQYQMR